MKVVIALIILLFSVPVHGQYKRMKKKVSCDEGTMYGYWGYNRSVYTKSDIRQVGPGYDFTLANSVAKDNPASFDPSVYFNPQKMGLTQFNARVGYYFKNHWAASIGIDHLKYNFIDGNQVLLSGTINDGVDSLWNGTYNAEPVETNNNHFLYQNQGLNHIKLGIERTDHFVRFGGLDQFVISSTFGAGIGGLVTSNDFTFAQQRDVKTTRFSGYAVSINAGARLEFFRHFFIQPNFSAGVMHQVRVNTRQNDPSSYARHAYSYAELDMLFGFFLYIRPKNGCDSCPVW